MTKKYDLEERTAVFAREVRGFVRQLPPSISNTEDGKQLIRSSGSVGANYIEANESLGKKDFLMRIRICRKESKESRLWLNLSESLPENYKEKEVLIKESIELTKIFGSILENSK